MKLLVDSFWRAAAYCVHPKVMLMSVLPLLLSGGLAGVLGYFYWEQAVAGVRATMEGWLLVATFLQWLDSIGGSAFRTVLAPLIVVALVVPVIVVLSLLLVALLMTPALVNLVAARRFPLLHRLQGGSWWQGLLLSLGSSVLALSALVVSIPLWLIPPLVLVLPPLIWGWLTYKVLSYDVLAEHAGRSERIELLQQHRWPLFGIGIVSGYLGAAPSLLWAFSALTLVFAPVLILLAVWIYTLVFAFSALWFTHYTLAALRDLRASRDGGRAASTLIEGIVTTPPPAPPPPLPPSPFKALPPP